MKLAPFILILLTACSVPQYVYKGVQEGVELSYRWNHPVGKPSELLMKMKNTATEDRSVSLVIDLAYQGRTVETLEIDTCIRAGHTMNGRLNGVYFVPTRLTTEQIKSGDATADLSRSIIAKSDCP
jgi:hypothetical protein